MDRHYGQSPGQRMLPTVEQLQRLLAATDVRGQAMIWMAIGLGFGQRDLAAVRLGQIDEISYDLRRGKTGIERFGETPPLVWNIIERYLATTNRARGELLFVTRKGQPLVHGRTDSIVTCPRSLYQYLCYSRAAPQLHQRDAERSGAGL